MMYGLLLPEGEILDRLPAILAETFRVEVAQTDVSDSSELENRNWDAIVTCEYERLDGDLTWSLGIYAAAEVEQHPSEAQLASLLAQRLGIPVFFSWDGGLPGFARLPCRTAARRSLAQRNSTTTSPGLQSKQHKLQYQVSLTSPSRTCPRSYALTRFQPLSLTLRYRPVRPTTSGTFGAFS